MSTTTSPTSSTVPTNIVELNSARLRWICPSCKSPLTQVGQPVHACKACGAQPSTLGSGIANFLGGDTTVAEKILGWTDEFVTEILAWVDGTELDTVPSEQLRRHLEFAGLLDPQGNISGIGRLIIYHLSEYRWQTTENGQVKIDEQFSRFMNLAGVDKDSLISDIGCGAGQTLRLLNSYKPLARIGIDLDAETLAFGFRIASDHENKIAFARASGHALPLPDR